MSVLKPRRTYKPADERKQQILDCALGAFAGKGYHDTSIADVCSRAGIGRATLYQYFTDKRDLLVALAERIEAKVTRSIEQREPLHFPPGFKPTQEQAIAFVEARIAEILRVVFEDAATARLIVRAGRGADSAVDAVLRRIDETVLATMEDELRRAKQAGVIRAVDERFVARFLLGGMEKILMTYLDEERPIDVEAIAHEAALLEVCGIFRRNDT
jgi:TetR/AcrR family transcriptional regulator, fatty acid metabolism regulator protein